MSDTHDARHELVSAAANYLSSYHWDYVHPEGPYRDASMDLAEEILDRAVTEYVKARDAAAKLRQQEINVLKFGAR